jgi:hypothetical protein
MGSKLDPPGNFSQDSYSLPTVPGQLLHSANIWYRAESRPSHGQAEGQDVTRFGPSLPPWSLFSRSAPFYEQERAANIWIEFAPSRAIAYINLVSGAVSKMPPRTEDSIEYRRGAGYSAPLNVILLAISGLALLGAGALLAFRSGTFMSFGDAMLAAVAWCL